MPDSIENLEHLNVLDVKHNNLISLPLSIIDLPHLEWINTRNNNFKEGYVQYLIQMLQDEDKNIEIDY